MVDIVGSVGPEEVPQDGGKAFGVWTGLAHQVIEAHEQGKVLVVKVGDRAEYKKMVNGMSERLRVAGYARRFVTRDEPDGGVQAWLRLEDSSRPSNNGLVSVAPANRRRRRGER